MNIFRFLGVGADSILANGCHVPGVVTKAERCWWLSVKTRPARLYTSNRNTLYAHKITFTYTVDAVSYEGVLLIGPRYRCPQKGETIRVYYAPSDPRQYACYAFAPESLQ